MLSCKWEPRDDELFPEGFPDVGGRTFLWVKQNRQEFCEFCVHAMTNTSGLFEAFQTYLKNTE